MATTAQTLPQRANLLSWFGQFLRDELMPYPGRTALVARMVLAATIVMIICMTFQLSFAFQGAIFALLISRESVQATIRMSARMAVSVALGTAYVLTSIWFVLSFPMIHLVWVMASFFLAFFVLSAASDYNAAVLFAFIIAIAIPLWDRYVSAETNVEDTLRLAFAALIPVLVTTAIELLFARRRTGGHSDEILLPLADRLNAVGNLLECYAENCPLDPVIEKHVLRLAMVGTSLLRRILQRSDFAARYKEQASALVVLTARLVDGTANLTLLDIAPSDEDRARIGRLSRNIAGIRADLLAGKIPYLREPFVDTSYSHSIPLLTEMQHTVSLLVDVYVDSRPLSIFVPPDSTKDPPHTIFARDTLSNSVHLKFALKGCLTASLCYIIYNAVAWPGISTAVTTCFATALTTVGSSRQKQVLRFAGATVGGFVFGMGSQVFILPYVDSIGGFTIIFLIVTAISAWFMTSSARLSYFGFQMALAYYLINLQEFAFQTSLAIARDRVVGVMVGLLMMWCIFDQLWIASAVVEMRKNFVSSLRLIAQFAREPLLPDLKVAIDRAFTLRESISTSLNGVRASADGVLLEFGPSRQQDLTWRTRILGSEARLRTLFLMGIELWKYRAQVPGFALPEPIHSAQRRFDNEAASVLEGIADRVEGKTPARAPELHQSLENLQQVVGTFSSAQEDPALAAELETFLPVCQRTESLESLLDQAF
jgi:multidrug resistance protein MdtO